MVIYNILYKTKPRQETMNFEEVKELLISQIDEGILDYRVLKFCLLGLTTEDRVKIVGHIYDSKYLPHIKISLFGRWLEEGINNIKIAECVELYSQLGLGDCNNHFNIDGDNKISEYILSSNENTIKHTLLYILMIRDSEDQINANIEFLKSNPNSRQISNYEIRVNMLKLLETFKEIRKSLVTAVREEEKRAAAEREAERLAAESKAAAESTPAPVVPAPSAPDAQVKPTENQAAAEFQVNGIAAAEHQRVIEMKDQELREYAKTIKECRREISEQKSIIMAFEEYIKELGDGELSDSLSIIKQMIDSTKAEKDK